MSRIASLFLLSAAAALIAVSPAVSMAEELPGIYPKLREAELKIAVLGREDAVLDYATQKVGSTDPVVDFLFNYVRPEREDAESWFRTNMAKAQEKGPYQFALGAIYTEWKVDDRAIKALDGVIAGDPKNLLAYYHRGLYHMRREEPDEARADFGAALSIDPSFALPHLALANMLRKKGDDDKAIQEYSEAIRLEPSLFDAHYALGQMLMAKGRFDESIAEMKKAGELRPGNADVQLQLASAFEKMGRNNEALMSYKMALAAKQGDPEILVSIGRIEENLGDRDAVYDALSTAVKNDCKDPQVFLKLGWLALDRKENDKAEKYFLDAAKQRPDDYKVFLGLARVSARKDDYRKAIDYYRRTLILESASREARDELSAIQAKFYISPEKFNGKNENVVYENFKLRVLKAYKTLLKTTPGLKGSVTVRVTIDGDGNVTDVQMDGSTLARALDVAIYGNAFQAKFPPAARGTQYNMPLKLTPAAN